MNEGFVLVHKHIESKKDNLVENLDLVAGYLII